jgi:hypothetical protein
MSQTKPPPEIHVEGSAASQFQKVIVDVAKGGVPRRSDGTPECSHVGIMEIGVVPRCSFFSEAG